MTRVNLLLAVAVLTILVSLAAGIPTAMGFFFSKAAFNPVSTIVAGSTQHVKTGGPKVVCGPGEHVVIQARITQRRIAAWADGVWRGQCGRPWKATLVVHGSGRFVPGRGEACAIGFDRDKDNRLLDGIQWCQEIGLAG